MKFTPFLIFSVTPKRSTASAETVAVKTVPVTRPAPPTIPVTTSHVPVTTSHVSHIVQGSLDHVIL